jgi:hypothetical protein
MLEKRQGWNWQKAIQLVGLSPRSVTTAEVGMSGGRWHVSTLAISGMTLNNFQIVPQVEEGRVVLRRGYFINWIDAYPPNNDSPTLLIRFNRNNS